jgi:hypothetical protein
MSISAIFGVITGILKAIPVFQKWVEEFFKFYADQQIKAHNKNFVEALAALIANGNQIPLEEAIGNSNAGSPARRSDGVRTRPRRAEGQDGKTTDDGS